MGCGWFFGIEPKYSAPGAEKFISDLHTVNDDWVSLGGEHEVKMAGMR